MVIGRPAGAHGLVRIGDALEAQPQLAGAVQARIVDAVEVGDGVPWSMRGRSMLAPSPGSSAPAFRGNPTMRRILGSSMTQDAHAGRDEAEAKADPLPLRSAPTK